MSVQTGWGYVTVQVPLDTRAEQPLHPAHWALPSQRVRTAGCPAASSSAGERQRAPPTAAGRRLVEMNGADDTEKARKRCHRHQGNDRNTEHAQPDARWEQREPWPARCRVAQCRGRLPVSIRYNPVKLTRPSACQSGTVQEGDGPPTFLAFPRPKGAPIRFGVAGDRARPGMAPVKGG
eukprot:gene13667-biopygen5044